jgi:hypothetical protein
MCVASAAGFLLLTVAFLACGVGFIAPQWVYFPPDFVDKVGLDSLRSGFQKLLGVGGRPKYVGLLGRCFAPETDCVWFWDDDFAMEKNIEGQYPVGLNVLPFNGKNTAD